MQYFSLVGCDDDSSTSQLPCQLYRDNYNTQYPFSIAVNNIPFTCGTVYKGVGNAVTDSYLIQ
ncbi:MAG: hypothetical protein R3E08_04975 [Thiotrichaceae bacterium]